MTTTTTTYLYKRQHVRWQDLPAEVQANLVARGLADKPIRPPVPDTFPGYEALLEAGFTTLTSIPHDRPTLEAIKGIGPKTAGDILHALGVEVTVHAD